MKIDALTLLERWQQGQLDDAGVAMLRRVLDDPRQAAALAAEVRHVYALREALHQQRATTHHQRGWWQSPLTWVAAAALLVISVATWLWWPTPQWRLKDGTVVVMRTGDERRLTPDAALRPGDVVITDQQTATLQAPDGTRVEIAATSRVEAAVLAGAVRFMLARGAVTCAITPQGAGSFSVHTAQAEVVVRGTRFTVAADEELTRVAVEEGSVSVHRRADGAELSLAAGGRTSVRATGDLRDEALREPGPPWSDRRPLALLRMWVATDATGNPRSYDHVPPGADLTTADGRRIYATALAQAGTTIGRRLVSAGYQGVIVWDIEGKQHNDLLYVGDPRRLPELAPEMDLAADGFFAALRQAGLRTGVLLRPQRLERDVTAASGWRQRGDVDPAAELVAKATWVRQRWGCSLFFINAMTATPGADGRHLPTGALASLATAVGAERGDSLIITDRPSAEEWGVAAGWFPLMASGPSPLPEAVIKQHPRLVRVNYWPANTEPPAITGAHEILMREADHLVP